MNEKNCEDEYAKLWQMYGNLEDERDRLRAALEMFVALADRIEQYGAMKSENDWYKVAAIRSVARVALQEEE